MVISKDLRIKVYANKRKITENYSNVALLVVTMMMAAAAVAMIVVLVVVVNMRKRIIYLYIYTIMRISGISTNTKTLFVRPIEMDKID